RRSLGMLTPVVMGRSRDDFESREGTVSRCRAGNEDRCASSASCYIARVMHLGQDVLSDLPRALATEWLLTNGLGGSASGTVAGANTRRAHGVLIATGPHGRLSNLLLGFDERLHAGDAPVDLSTRIMGGAARPDGHRWLETFRIDPWPVW